MTKGYKHLTARQKEIVLATYKETLQTKKAAQASGATLLQVRHLLKKHGIKPSGATGGRCYDRIDDLRRWATEGVSHSEMARRIGTTHSAVADFLKKHKFERKPFLQVGSNNPAWKGGRMFDKSGYVLLRRPDHPGADRHGYVREHRLVMEALLNRRLLPTEVVHHKDDDHSNNDPSNLEVFASNGEHLAATLAGKCPKWSEDGRRRILEAIRRPRRRRGTATPTASEPGGLPSP